MSKRMKQYLKRVLALIMCAVMTAGMAPDAFLAAFAGSVTEVQAEEAAEENVFENENEENAAEDQEELIVAENAEEESADEAVDEDTISGEDIGDAVSENEVSEIIPDTDVEVSSEEPAGNPGKWAKYIHVALNDGSMYYGGADAPSGVSYDENTHTLTLDNFSNTTGYYKEGLYSYSGIEADGDLIIEVKGNCVVKPKPEMAGYGSQHGIDVLGNLTIRNVEGYNGTLTVHANESDDYTIVVTDGIFAQGDLTIEKNGNGSITLSATSANAKGWREKYNYNDGSCGLHAYGNIVIDGKGTKGGATVIAQSESNLNGESYGIYSGKEIEIKNGAKVIAKGAKGDKAGRLSYGLYARKQITISGEKTVVEAYGGTLSGYGNATENSASDNISYGMAVGRSYFDYYTEPGSINIEGGTVTAKGGGATGYHTDPKDNGARVISVGIFTNDLTIGNATVITEGGNPDPGLSYGTYIITNKVDYQLSVRYGKLTGKGHTGAIVCSNNITYDTPILEGSTSYSGSNLVLQNSYNSSWKYVSMDAKRVVIDIEGWTYGDTPNTPSVHNVDKYGDGNVEVTTCKFNVENPVNAGSYRAHAVLSNGLEAYKTINIAPRDIADAVINFGTQNVYNGSSQAAVITSVICGGRTLTEGTDYTITSGGNATNVGETTLTITGKGNYKGTASGTWSLQKATLAYTDFSNINSRVEEHIEYDGTYKYVTTPVKSGVGKITVWYRKNKTETYEERVKEPGTYRIFFDVAESNNYKAASKLTYGDPTGIYPENRMTIYKKYGEPVECVPTAKVQVGGTVDLMPNTAGALGTPTFTIEEGSDETSSGGCTVDENTGLFTAGSGTGTCIVTVKSTATDYYMGWRSSVTAYITVTVTNKSTKNVTVTQADTTFGTSLPAAQFDHTGWTSGPVYSYTGTTAAGVAYSSESAPNEAGSYEITVTGEDAGFAYSGSAQFVIAPRNIENAVVTFGNQPVYNGTEKSAVISSVTLGEKELTASDYEVLSGGIAVDVTEQVVEIQGKGNYTGTATSATTWKLRKGALTADDFDVSVISDRYYTGNTTAAVSEPSLKGARTGCGDITIYYSGTSYEKSITPPTDAGNYTVTFDVAEGANYNSSATEFYYGNLSIIRTVFNGDKEVYSGGQVDVLTTLDLSKYIQTGGSLEGLYTDSGALTGLEKDGSSIKYKFKEDTAVGTEAVVTMQVRDSKNYQDYNLTVNLTAEHKHVLEHFAAKAETCTEEGHDEYWICTLDDCDKYFSDDEGTCPVEYITLIKPAPGHNWGDWKTTKAANTTEAGEETRECSRCHIKQTREIYTVSFDLNGKPGTAPAAQRIVTGEKALKPGDPAAEGSDFVGWYTDAAGENCFDFSTPITDNLTLYAHWADKEVTSVTLSENKISIRIGEEKELKVSFDPENAKDKTLTWSSSNDKVVTVDANGTIKGIWPGSAKITAVTANGKSAVCDVTVVKSFKDDGDDTVKISPEDFDSYVLPEKQEHKPVTPEPVSVKLKDGTEVKVSVSANYMNAVAYTGKAIKPEADLQASCELDSILKVAGVSGVKADEIFKVTYVSKNKNAGAARFYAKISLVKGARKKFKLSKDQEKLLKAILKEVNKAMKKNQLSYTINKASMTELAEIQLHAKTSKDGKLNVNDKGKIKGFKNVKIKYKADDKKAVKLSPKAGYTYTVTDAATCKVKITGNKNFTGSVTVKAEK